MMADIKQAHKHQMFRVMLPAIMVIVAVHFFITGVMPQPFAATESPETFLRNGVKAIHIFGFSAYLYVWRIDDDERAHRMLVRLNEINTLLASAAFVVYLNWLAATGGLSSFTLSPYSLAQVGAFFCLCSFITNIFVFPDACRWRLLLYVSVALAFEPTFTPLPQPMQALYFIGAWMAGELSGRVCYRALLQLYMRQEVEKAQLLQQAHQAIEHSRHIESERREQLIAMKSREGKQQTQRARRGNHPRSSPGGLTPIVDESHCQKDD